MQLRKRSAACANRTVHRLPVVRGGIPVGMISRQDLLRLMLPRKSPPDSTLQATA